MVEEPKEKRRRVKVVPNPPSVEEKRPEAILELFSRLEGDELTMKTETPTRLILPLVILRVIQEADNPKRVKPLTQVFLEELDRRMISSNRKGRVELLEALRASAIEKSKSIEIPF